MAQRGAQTSIPHKNHFIRPDPIRWNPGQLGFVPLFFPRLKLYNVLKLNLFYSGLKVLDCFCFELFSAALYIAFKVFSITIWWCATFSCPHCKFRKFSGPNIHLSILLRIFLRNIFRRNFLSLCRLLSCLQLQFNTGT